MCIDPDGVYECWLLHDACKDHEFRQLVDRIKETGSLSEAVVVDERGYILRGHRQYRACLEAGVEPTVTRLDGLDTRGKLEIAVDGLRDRWQGNRMARARVARKLAETGAGGVRWIARVLGVDPSTVSRDVRLKQLDRGELPPTVGDDEKKYTRARQDRSAHLPRIPIEHDEYTLVQAPVTEWPRLLRKRCIDAILTETSGTLWADDLQGRDAPTRPVDFGRFSKLATRVPRRDPPIVIMLNEREVGECLHVLSPWHTFRGMLAFELRGAQWSTGGKTADWRPILCFTRGSRRGGNRLSWPPDGHVADGRGRSDDSVHCEDLIEAFTKPGDTILDPLLQNLGVLFAGIGMGREVVGLTTEDDIDAIDELAEDVLFSQRLETALERFEEEFRLCGTRPDTLMVRRRGTRAKPRDLLERPEEVLFPLLRDDLGLASDVAAELVAPMVDELRTRATRPQEGR